MGETKRKCCWDVEFGNHPRLGPERIHADDWEILGGALHFYDVDLNSGGRSTVLLLGSGTWKAMYPVKSDE
jgi:hypothetical protein